MFQASTVVPERFSFEPAAKELVPEDEDQEIEELFKAAEREMGHRGSESSIGSAAPPIPPRSDSQTLLSK